MKRAQLHVETVVVRLGGVQFMDATGMYTLSEIIERFRRRGILALVGVQNVGADMPEIARRVAQGQSAGPGPSKRA